MENKKNESKMEILADMKKITVEKKKKKAEQVALAIKKKYKKMPKAYRIMYLQHLEEVKQLTPLEIVFFNKFINK